MVKIWLLFLPFVVSITNSVLAADGLKAQITSVSFTSERRPVVTFKASDAKGSPLEAADLDADSIKFVIAAIRVGKNGVTTYSNYISSKVSGNPYLYNGAIKQPAFTEVLQPGFDRGGALTRVKAGVFTYTFNTALPPTYDRNATHVVGGEISRERGRYVANPVYEFVPSGGRVRVRRTVAETSACNTCHDPLNAHGGARREVGYCALCHTPELTDPETGESLDLKVFVHKIHQGKLLPTVREGKPFIIVGENRRVADFSNVRHPQALLSDEVDKDLRNCTVCHRSGPSGDHWKKFPSVAACTSCHTNVDLASGKNHKLGPQSEGSCVGCHPPDGPEFGPSIAGAHTFPGKSAQLPSVVFDIQKIEGGRPGTSPVVTFSVKTKAGETLDAGKMENLRLVIAWPTTDYRTAIEEDVRKAQSLGNGTYTYKFRYVIPPEAVGSGAIGIQGFKLYDLQKPNGSVIKAQRDVGFNLVKYFPITDEEPVPRRMVVKVENCNSCHGSLATHGETRRNTEFCVMCHNAAQTDGDKRKTAMGPLPAENIHFKRLIHRIHTGSSLGEPFSVYGGPPAKPYRINFSNVRFPGDRRNCAKCHVPGANEPPLPAGLLPTLFQQPDGSIKALQPITSACVGCHTQEAAKLHMETMTASNGQETCVTCHGVGRSFSVESVHQDDPQDDRR